MKTPPFSITPTILNASMSITHLLGELDGQNLSQQKVVLRKTNQIKTIQASLAIEGNTLSIEQVSDMLDGVKIIGPQKDIIEVNNAIVAYNEIPHLRYNSQADFKKAHQLLLEGLIADAGNRRIKNVGIFAGSRVAHVAPSHKIVPQLIDNLFAYLKKKDSISLLIKSCIFHYELEFIHPFSDGNGRMGRLWQHVILDAYHVVLQYVAIESLIKDKQEAYYSILAACDSDGASTRFIEFSLNLILEALQAYYDNMAYEPRTATDRLNEARKKLTGQFSRK
jgi:Fic family protein